MNYPKVLIIGQSFNKNTGGGITLSNLFYGWPNENIAVATTGQNLAISNSDICKNYYQLGFDENKKLWPFNYLQKKFVSGPVYFHKANQKNCESSVLKHFGLRNYLLTNFFIYIKKYGFYHFIDRYALSDKFLNWIREFNPDIIYTQLASLSLIRLTNELHKKTNIPYIIHIMDDWPSTIADKGFFNKKYLNKIIDNEFRKLIENAKDLLSIGEYMSDVYLKRYGFKFTPFQNCVDYNFWSKYKDIKKTNDTFVVLYAGRIGRGTSTSLLKIAESIDKLSSEGINIVFEIQTNNSKHPISTKLKKIKSVKFVPRLPYKALPKKFSSVDLLVLPIDFDSENIKFIKYSMPTKLPEYLSTGVPILVLSPSDTALSKFFEKNDLAFVVNTIEREVISTTINKIIDNIEQRKVYAEKAIDYSKANMDCNIVREKFKKEINKIIAIRNV